VTTYDAAAFDQFEAAAWTRRAQAYADLVMSLTAGGVDPLLDAAGAAPGQRLLDIGCGPGTVSAVAVARGATVTGVDAAEPMVRLATERVPQAAFRVGTVAGLPAPDDAFDCVVAGFVLLHVGTPELMAAEAARVCAPGGRVAFSVWDDLAVNRVLGVVQEAVTSLDAELAPVDVPPGPAFTRFADAEAMSELLAGAGLTDVHGGPRDGAHGCRHRGPGRGDPGPDPRGVRRAGHPVRASRRHRRAACRDGRGLGHPPVG
jgi:SAM-dependent methyltransferase